MSHISLAFILHSAILQLPSRGKMSKKKTQSAAAAVEAAMQSSSIERGHRLGNYHNYYFHHPPSNRIDVLEEQCLIHCIARRLLEKCKFLEISPRKKQRTNDQTTCDQAGNTKNLLKYCDLGCNEGDLTIALANAVLERCHELSSGNDDDKGSNKHKNINIECLGLDIDPTLIERANTKYGSSNDPKKKDGHSDIDARFEICNLCDDAQHVSKYKVFLGDVERFDLTTLFSTTMWIHVHAGDDGLRDFLKRTCDKTDMLVVEPQISKCYGRANTRLRKMDRPELDSVTSQELSMRGNIEEEIEKSILACGFIRVTTVEEDKERRAGTSDANRTAWKRQIQLYVRE